MSIALAKMLLARIRAAAQQTLDRLRGIRVAPRVRRALQVGLPLAAAGILVVIAGFAPIVRSKAAGQAARRGIELEIRSVRPGWGRVWLRDVIVRVPEVPAAELRLDAIEADLTLGLGVEAIFAHGGALRIKGELAELERQLRAWRAKTAREPTGRSKGSIAIAVEGLHVEWQLDTNAPQELWGVRYQRDASGREQLAADFSRIRWRGGQLELLQPSVSLTKDGDRRVLDRVTTEAVLATLTLDGEGLEEVLRKPGEPGPSAAKSSARQLDRLEAPTRAPSNAAAPPKLAVPTTFPDSSAVERGAKLRSVFARLAGLLEGTLPNGGELDLSGVRLKLRHGRENLNVGPGRLHVHRGSERVAVSFTPGTEAKDALALRLNIPLESGQVQVEIDGGPVSLAALGVNEGDLGLLDVGKTQVEAKGQVTLASDGSTLGFSGTGRVRELSLQHQALASRAVRGVILGWRGKGELALDGTRWRFDEAELELGRVRIQVAGELERGASYTRASFKGTVPLASCQAMLDSVPEGLMPLLADLRMSGTFVVDGKLEFDTRKLSATRAVWTLANECRITATPAEVAPRRFKSAWVRDVLGADGRVVQLESGPGTAGWVPFSAISPHMETAVLICEDGAFRRHRGFDDEAIQNSIRENIRFGRFFRGASTISMQLAKNLYLPREKTLSRKMQEAVLTLLLEQELSKDEILELYLNVIEFGPGIYGIGRAAQYYFNTSAGQLSLGQALYLASILPNPKQSHFGADGHVTPGWSNYLRKLMQIAVKIRRITEEELEDAMREQVIFGVPYSPRNVSDGETGFEEDSGRFSAPVEETSFAP